MKLTNFSPIGLLFLYAYGQYWAARSALCGCCISSERKTDLSQGLCILTRNVPERGNKRRIAMRSSPDRQKRGDDERSRCEVGRWRWLSVLLACYAARHVVDAHDIAENKTRRNKSREGGEKTSINASQAVDAESICPFIRWVAVHGSMRKTTD